MDVSFSEVQEIVHLSLKDKSDAILNILGLNLIVSVTSHGIDLAYFIHNRGVISEFVIQQ